MDDYTPIDSTDYLQGKDLEVNREKITYKCFPWPNTEFISFITKHKSTKAYF